MRFLKNAVFIAFIFNFLSSCGNNATKLAEQMRQDSLRAVELAAEEAREAEERERNRDRTKDDIQLKKELRYDKYTLEDEYEYDGQKRSFQWEKIKENLAYLENFERRNLRYAVLQNHRNKNGEAPLVKTFTRNDYKRVSDSLGTERYQSVPLYLPDERDKPTLYGLDGFLVALESADSLEYIRAEGLSMSGKWDIPKRYVKTLNPETTFKQVVFVDVSNQHIVTLERSEEDYTWNILSMNPATTGVHKPPYAKETPLGMFLIQEKKKTMYFLKDGTRSEIAGFAPYASRFCNGGYIHGVPVNYPQKSIIEHSWSLGTVPRSHMCVRNASSHAKFVFEWAETLASLVFIID